MSEVSGWMVDPAVSSVRGWMVEIAEAVARVCSKTPTHFLVHPVAYEKFFGKRPRNPKWNGQRWVKRKRNLMSARRRSK